MVENWKSTEHQREYNEPHQESYDIGVGELGDAILSQGPVAASRTHRVLSEIYSGESVVTKNTNDDI